MKFTHTLCILAGLISTPLALGLRDWRSGVAADLGIRDTYIVRYKTDVDPNAARTHEADIISRARKASRKGILGKFDLPGLQGYVVEIPPSVAKGLAESDLIESVEPDAVVKTAAVIRPPDRQQHDTDTVTQHGAPWGLSRISQRSRYHSSYHYSEPAGEGVRVYVLDTGIRTGHSEFEGRAVWGGNFVPGSPDADEAGHGTHVAGTIAGKTYGVAKKATVVAVKVLDETGSGYMSRLLQGLSWAVSDARDRGVADRSVINLSLGGAYMASVNAAVKAATDAGLTVVVAAGNENDDAANWSPASAPTAITVGAIDSADRRAEFSNWGAHVDIFAPGVSVLSASNGTDIASRYMTGTSMAAPHVAGLAAYFIAKDNLSGYAAVSQRILESANPGVRDRKGAADRIAYNDAHGA